MKKFDKRNLIYMIIAVGVNLMIAALAIFVFGVRYCTDDDLSMAYIAYGIYMKPSSRIIYSNVVIGWFMKTLFGVRETINWLVVLYFAGLCTGGFIALYEILKTRSAKLLVLWSVFVSCFFYCSFVSITFTLVSAYICCQGYLAFFLSIKREEKMCMVLSGLMIVYASLIRVESVMAISMCAAVSWCMVVFSFVKKEGNFNIKSIARRYVWPFVAVVVGIGVFYVGDKLAYSSDEWAEYYEYYLLRGEILDDCSIINMGDTKRQRDIGISEAAATSLNEWYFNDPEVFDSELFSKIDEISSDLRGEYITHPFEDMCAGIRQTFCSHYIFRVSILTLWILAVWAFVNGIVVKGVALLGALVPYLIQMFAYCYMGRYADVLEKVFPQRLIEITVMGFFACFFIIEAGFEQEEEKSYFSAVLVMISLVASVFLQVHENYDFRGFSLKSESMIEEKYSYLNDGHIYVMEYRALQRFMDEYRAWQNPPQGYLNNFITLGGCEVNYPLLVEKQNELGVNNPYKALFEDSNVVLLAPDYPEIELAYLRDMYDENIECELVDTHDELNVYNFSIN